MKSKKYYIVGKIPKFDRIIVETKAQSTPLTHIYMTLTHIHMTTNTHTYDNSELITIILCSMIMYYLKQVNSSSKQ